MQVQLHGLAGPLELEIIDDKELTTQGPTSTLFVCSLRRRGIEVTWTICVTILPLALWMTYSSDLKSESGQSLSETHKHSRLFQDLSRRWSLQDCVRTHSDRSILQAVFFRTSKQNMFLNLPYVWNTCWAVVFVQITCSHSLCLEWLSGVRRDRMSSIVMAMPTVCLGKLRRVLLFARDRYSDLCYHPRHTVKTTVTIYYTYIGLRSK